MVAVALLLPPALLCLVLALGRYEECLLKNSSCTPRHALPKRHLRAVPDVLAEEEGESAPAGPGPHAGAPAGDRGSSAA
ncbi:hypothetical protein [Streptomyces cinnamoneus]|uniref:hypothetical protein n=1 Tax=Streptomyces cinnamoneus TaxID=53446 RepID=UPI00379B4B31